MLQRWFDDLQSEIYYPLSSLTAFSTTVASATVSPAAIAAVSPMAST